MTVLKSLSLTIVLSSFVVLSNGQPINPNPGDPPHGDPDAVPITGLEYLLVAGGIYGISKLRRKDKPKEPGM